MKRLRPHASWMNWTPGSTHQRKKTKHLYLSNRLSHVYSKAIQLPGPADLTFDVQGKVKGYPDFDDFEQMSSWELFKCCRDHDHNEACHVFSCQHGVCIMGCFDCIPDISTFAGRTLPVIPSLPLPHDVDDNTTWSTDEESYSSYGCSEDSAYDSRERIDFSEEAIAGDANDPLAANTDSPDAIPVPARSAVPNTATSLPPRAPETPTSLPPRAPNTPITSLGLAPETPASPALTEQQIRRIAHIRIKAAIEKAQLRNFGQVSAVFDFEVIEAECVKMILEAAQVWV